MEKELQDKITDEIQNILCCAPTATELAEWYFRHRPSGSTNASIRGEIRQTLSEFDLVSGKQDVIDEITEAYLHFTAYILYEDGFFVNNKIHDMLLSLEQLHTRIDENKKTLELLHNMPVSVNPKAELMARDQLSCNSQEPIYVTRSQLTELQMLCLRTPEAINNIIHLMGQRPFIKTADTKDKPYLQACIKVLYALISNSVPIAQNENGTTPSELKTVLVGILNAFYNEYLCFSSDDYLIDLVNDSISESFKV